MNININPFQQLFLSDDVQTESSFVELFSDEVLQSAINPIFQGGGNVVLKGTQGCGKTMVLNLLRPKTRISYYKLGQKFPVQDNMTKFVSAGINLTQSGIAKLVQVTLGDSDAADCSKLPHYFADFFNYIVVKDILDNIKTIGMNGDVFDNLVNLSKKDDFAKCLVGNECWFGSLNGIKTFDELNVKINDRILFYKKWLNGNLDDLSQYPEIHSSKTNIGEPISQTAVCLRYVGVIAEDVPVLIRIDQIEELHRAFSKRQQNILLSFRYMLNRVFALRNSNVCYCAATRPYGWDKPDCLNVWGSDAKLENRRDYNIVDMDKELFLNTESTKSIFGRFAIDAFQKRILYYFKNEVGSTNINKNLAKSVFGESPSPVKRLGELKIDLSDPQIDRILGLNLVEDKGKWSTEWIKFLRRLFKTTHEGMLNATLAAAWGRQTGGANSKLEHRQSPPPDDTPWIHRKWWRKERLNQAVLQLMTRSQQRFMWWGLEDILSLSGGNITVFLHICHRVWDAFLKNESSLPVNKRTDLLTGGMIDHRIQASGIQFASNEWFEKLPEEPRGNSRQMFIEKLGVLLNESILRDLSMSYPGGNGISISFNEYKTTKLKNNLLIDFMEDAVGYGVLIKREHTSRSKNVGMRIKFYISNILCPRFQIPETMTKEPLYWSVEKLYEFVKKSKVFLLDSSNIIQRKSNDDQLLLRFEDPES